MINISMHNIRYIYIKYIRNLTRFLHEFLNTFQPYKNSSNVVTHEL